MHWILEAAVFLLAALIAVPLFRRAGFGAVLGYLAAGMIIGPFGLGLLNDGEAVMHVAELGVVFLLFVIGLELKPMRLWRLRKAILGSGSLQMLTATLPIAWVVHAVWDLPLATSLLIGFALALSSTAFVLQSLAEQGELSSQHGRGAFGVLLFQDLAVIPALAILPALAANGPSSGDENMLWPVLRGLAAVVALILGGRFLLRPMLRAVARWGSEETFTVAALLVVIGAALAMEAAHLSAGLGAFLAGVLLAESEYRHELEGNINPFKGLLLGLFFIGVGMSADLGLVREAPGLIIGGALLLIGLKASLLALVARFALRLPWEVGLPMSLILAQGGEFAFVLLHAASGLNILPLRVSEELTAIVILSMALTPLLFLLAARLRDRLQAADAAEFDTIAPADEHPPVIIAGFGRMGQIVARVLHMRGIAFTALERDAAHVDLVRRWGNKVYFGEPASLETLRAAGAREARLLVITLDDFDAARRVVELAQRHFPHLQLYCRARDRHQAMHLMELGVSQIIRETWHSSLVLAEGVLRSLGDDADTASYSIEVFMEADQDLLRRQLEHREDTEHMIQTAKAVRTELRSLFEDAPRISPVPNLREAPETPLADSSSATESDRKS